MAPERFIYYRVADDTPSLRQALRAVQHELARRHPRLQARLLCRSAEGSEPATWMETYAQPGGVDNALLAEIEALAASALGARLVGLRRVESFEPCAW